MIVVAWAMSAIVITLLVIGVLGGIIRKDRDDD